MNNKKILKVMIDTAYKAGKYIKKNVGKIKKLDYKGSLKNVVTNVDKGAENIIIKELKKAYPEFDILAEESGVIDGGGTYKWIIDPLDGTTNFSHGFPHFSVSIALEQNGEIIAGVVYDPMRDEMFYASYKGGAFLNRKRIHVSRTSMLAKSLLVTGFAYDIKKHLLDSMKIVVNILLKVQELRRVGSAALDLCYVACGRFDGYWEQNLAPWDTAAGIIILKEAGGKVTTFDSGKYDCYKKEILASNNKIHKDMIKVINLKK